MTGNWESLLALIADPGRMMLFSAEVYASVVAAYNRVSLPVIVLATVGGVVLVSRLMRGRAVHAGAVFAGLAALWLWVGLVFLGLHYRPINWAAGTFAAIAVVQGLSFAVYAFTTGRRTVVLSGGCSGRLGTTWMMAALAFAPVSVLLGADPWAAQYFAAAPATLAWASFGVVLCTGGRAWWHAALVAPVAVVEGFTGWAIDERLAVAVWLLFAASLVAAPFCRRRA
ncbi:MAG: DUF6064 family protein [Gammaproteobacteria bacterium]|nr:DUF6064 family protein [Gammaproteobacteria bacterium]